ncbi:uncharacterized protein LOC112570317 [Pomacea canaliculata]|uniref:uncharacterized protein LOC112570317 n=1 Tax=Pomacea canaliculata TaxID=400727 RepID=UPI000D72B111|nr:uncharacterized protein LOC112570317 [Pomacea canaliculata]
MYQKLFALVLVYYVAEMSMSSQLQSQREDVMGTYFLLNRYQCERLCWYRKLCKTYSYIYNRTLATDGNCVLHAYNITSNTTSGVSTDWVERESFWDKGLQDNGCRNRTCDDTQVCVPTFASPFYACLPFPAECKAPSRDDGVYSNVTLLQGQRTNFTCNSSLVWAPRHADKTVTCQVNGKYSELKGTCKNTTYYSPSVPFNKPFPDVVSNGWEACFKGNVTKTKATLERMTFNFHDRQDASCDSSPAGGGNIYLCLDFRYDFKIQQTVVLYTALNNCSWSSRGEIPNLPLHLNDYFEITLKILFNNTMQIIYKNLTTQQVDLVSKDIPLTNAMYLEIVNDVSLSYVNLGRGCD